MKTIIAGSRDIKEVDWELAVALYGCPFYDQITEIVSGNCRGADKAGERFARIANIKLTVFPANWHTHGKKAGYIRNVAMANYADALIAIWDKKSKGTKHMIDIAKKKGLKVFVHEIS